MTLGGKAFLSFVLLLLGLGFCTTSVFAHETLKFDFDERNWKPGLTKHTKDYDMYAYLVGNQTMDNWQELVTYQFMPELQEMTTAKVFMNDFFERIKKISPSLESNIISVSDDDALFDWKITGSVPDKQYELDRVQIGKEGLHFLHYSNKDPNVSERDRQKWLAIFKKAQLATE